MEKTIEWHLKNIEYHKKKARFIWLKKILTRITHNCKNHLKKIKQEGHPYDYQCKKCGEVFGESEIKSN